MKLDLSTGNISSYLRTLPLLRCVQAMPGLGKNWFRGTRIYSYLERRINKHKQFKRDKLRLWVSIRFYPQRWTYTDMTDMSEHGPRCYCLVNEQENHELWIANSAWGLHFIFNGTYYGGSAVFGSFVPWRRKLYKLGITAVERNWIKARKST